MGVPLVPGLDRRVRIFPDLGAASGALARHLRESARASARERGRFSLVLSGGRTPVDLFHRLGRSGPRSWPWRDVEVFFADERCVPARSADSNFGSAWNAFLSRVPIPRRRVHRMRGELAPPSEAARRYGRLLGAMPRPGTGEPRFDAVLLGIGPDGHTASLFPDSPAVREPRAAVVPVVRSPVPPFVPRLTLTPAALSSAREVCFLVAGNDKAGALDRTFRASSRGDPRSPASCIRPDGPTTWFLDRAAAGRLAPGAA